MLIRYNIKIILLFLIKIGFYIEKVSRFVKKRLGSGAKIIGRSKLIFIVKFRIYLRKNYLEFFKI
jgi:hypothetical protein